jgi:protease-4
MKPADDREAQPEGRRRVMFRFLFRMLALTGLTALAGLVVGGVVLYRLLFAPPELPRTVVLELDLDQALVEQNPEDPVADALSSGGLTLRDVVEALERGRTDPRVKGLVARLGEEGLGFAQAQEVRAALARFRASGRFAFGFAESFGDFGPGNKAYYLAAAFDQVWLQPVGMVGLTGLAAEVPFARKALDWLHVVPDIGHREEYKSAMEPLTEPGFSKPHREMTESLLDDLTGQLVAGIAADRRLAPATLRTLIDRGPLTDREAKEAGLIDRLGYWDQVLEEAKAKAGSDADTVEPGDYLAAAGTPHEDGPTIALIYGVGGIERGKGGVNPMLGGTTLGSDKLVQAFHEAIEDDDVRAILFRIDSPGGSAVASEAIRRAVLEAKAAGKPVIVSMGDTAASGGYWIAMNADRIIAAPATLTGSIGVLAGKMATGGLWESLGVTWESIRRGGNAAMWSSVTPFDAAGRERLETMLDSLYATFTANVAEARKLAPEKVRQIARGRVWTGSQALDLGLVDELGDLELALTRTREAIGLAADAPVSLDVYPRPRSLLERLAELAMNGRAQGESSGSAAALVRSAQPLLARLAPLAAGDRSLRMTATGLER